MAIGIYIAVKGGEGGSITCSVGGDVWSNKRSSKSGVELTSAAAANFEAIPSSGYEFSYFEVYVDSSTTQADFLSKVGTYTDNPLSLSRSFVSSGQSYCVYAVFEATTRYYSVTVNSYKDGIYYTSNSYDIEEGNSFNLSYYVSSPSNYRLNYVYYGGQQYTYYPSFTIYSDMTISVYFKSRPSSWSWTYTIASGYEIKISATEWNNFTSRINAFRTYVGLSTYSFTTVYSGNAISTTICNQARNAIADLFGYQYSYSSMPSTLTTEGVLPASFFTGITNVLNAVS